MLRKNKVPLSAEPDPNVTAVVDELKSVFASTRARFQEGQVKTGLTAAQVWALTETAKHGEIGVGELAVALGLHQSTASNLIRPLLDRGLLQGERASEDRRAVRLSLSTAGRRLLRQAPNPFTGVLAQALSALDDDTLERLRVDLAKLARALDA